MAGSWEHERAAKSSRSLGVKWRWIVLALVPGLLGALIFASAVPVYWITRNIDTTMAVLWGGLYSVFALPPYLYFLGRRYVWAMHAGLKSALGFALLWCAPNLVIWLGGGGLAMYLLFPPR